VLLTTHPLTSLHISNGNGTIQSPYSREIYCLPSNVSAVLNALIALGTDVSLSGYLIEEETLTDLSPETWQRVIC